MAIRFAVATGNWSNTATWNGGTLPTSVDDVYANNFTVTINQNVTVLSLNTTAALGVNNGGTFALSGGTFNVVADTIQGGSSTCLSIGSNIIGTYTITANTINSGIIPNTGGAIAINSSVATVIVNGNINSYQGAAIDLPLAISVTINGNVIANGSGIGIFHRGSSALAVNGFCQGGLSREAYICTVNSAFISATITKAITQNNGVVAVINTGGSASTVTVKEIEQGVFGVVPIQGYVRLSTASGAFYKGVTAGISTRTLSDPADIAGQVPAQSDVRFGVTYQSGSKTGIAYIPSPSSVGFGVPVDNTTGTAALTPASVWDAATSSLTTSGSIGERLKNASTVDTTGDQLAALL
jgi:hypothetical protein